jgi:type IV pilus assembly protein PilY1
MPLAVGGQVPGNLALTPSVEWPTINSVANLGNYNENSTYTGYFDSEKCYQYNYSATEAERYFYPVEAASTNHGCTNSSAPWSGNFMNWAATQTIDPFRSALTGGYRVKDTPAETWLEKARHDGQGGTGIYPNRRIPSNGDNSTQLGRATPFGDRDWMRMRIEGLGNKMRFRLENDDVNNNVTAYDPSTRTRTDRAYEVSIRVAVCVTGLLELNCKQYSGGWKPEGTLQKYANQMRYSVFGYLNDSTITRDGGVLRAKQKYIGPQKPDGTGNMITNTNTEWDAITGVLVQNPDSSDAATTSSSNSITVSNSGVINYLNRFGQMTNRNHKSYDPVSELYYTATRYLKNQGNVSAYSSMSGTADEKYDLADGFPIITTWDDPVQYWCQANTILGIGDIYTHRDKNLPGSSCGNDEPTMPSAVSNDNTVDVVALTNKVGQLEGIGNIGDDCPAFTGRNNSAFMAGLAWDSRVHDIRPDLTGGKTTISTYWVDVLEAQSLEGMARNQFALAAKYGGVDIPDGTDPDTLTSLQEGWWHTNNETLTPFGGRGNGQAEFPRPDNFFVAGEADAMVSSLNQAFANIVAEMSGSGASLASNATKLDTGAQTFQAQFTSGRWNGELYSYDVDPDTGELASSPNWQASTNIPTWNSRNIYFNDGSGNHTSFNWGNLNITQTTELVSEEITNYLRGDRSNEQPDGSFRTRTRVLGDIVHSQPIYVGQPNPLAYAGATFTGASSYGTFASTQATRTPIIYVGANDGMLHGFNASNGIENYAFIPNKAIMNNLKSLSDPNYSHTYFVDGEMTVADVYYGGSWKTILVGTMGRGGPGIFALNITDPDNVDLLWEKTASDISALGRNIGKPIIAQIANGDWRVILGNGPDNASGYAQLIMVSISSGTATTINTNVGSSNALTAVFTWDTTGDSFMDTAYAGDLKGNLWRFNSLASTSTVQKIFQAKDASDQAQAITAAPLVGRNPDTGDRWVFFGTGKYLHESDLTSTDTQTWYGIIDSGSLIAGRDDLEARDILAEGTIGDYAARVIEEPSDNDMSGDEGWYMDLVSPVNGSEGERMVVPNKFQGRVLIGTTRIPDSSDVCRPTGRGFVMAIDPFTGARLDRTFFDFTGDDLFNTDDLLMVDGVPTVASGIGFPSGVNNPIFISDTMQTSLDDGSTEIIQTQGMTLNAKRTSWREIISE